MDVVSPVSLGSSFRFLTEDDVASFLLPRHHSLRLPGTVNDSRPFPPAMISKASDKGTLMADVSGFGHPVFRRGVSEAGTPASGHDA